MIAEMIDVECKDCLGRGTRTYEVKTRRFFDPFDEVEAECPTCEGTGVIDGCGDCQKPVENCECEL